MVTWYNLSNYKCINLYHVHCLWHSAMMHHPDPLSEISDSFSQLLAVLPADSARLSRVFRNHSGWEKHLAQGQAGLLPWAAHIQWLINFGTAHLNPAQGNCKRPSQLKISLEGGPRLSLRLHGSPLLQALFPSLPFCRYWPMGTS